MQNQENTNGYWVTCKQYVNRWGKLMIAEEYGYDYWRFFVRTKKR